MANEAITKFTWVIKNFSSLKSEFKFSDHFVAGACEWRLLAFPKGDKDNNSLSLYLYLVVPGYKTLPWGWKRLAKFSLTIVNQISDKLSERKEKEEWFDLTLRSSGFKTMIPLTKLDDKDVGFLVNNEVKIVAEVEVLEVIGNLDVSVESQEVTQPLRKIKLEKDAAESRDLVKGNLQVEFVSRVLKAYPDIALQLRAKKESLRRAGIFVSLIETLCKSMQELSNDDLMQAENALTFLKCSGIKVDWLEQKLEEVKEKKKQEQIGETRLQELEKELNGVKENCSDIEALLEIKKEELKGLKQKWSEIEALLEKEKANVLVARAPVLTVDEVV